MKYLFDHVKLNHTDLSNRLVRSATWEGISSADGSLPDEVYRIYDELAGGGIGMIITGFTSVSSNDFYIDGMMRLSDDNLIPQYKKLTDLIHHKDVPVISQLALGAFYRQDKKKFQQVEPDDMSVKEIHDVCDQFISAAVRAEKAGFDGVQIHAAHFFFLSRFISPAVNHRTDGYGGSTEKRSRLVLDILEGIKKAVPAMHVTIKINSNDFVCGGLDEKESLVICRMLASAGIDSIEVSGNGTSVSGIRPHTNEAYFGTFAAELAEKVNIPVILVGGLRSMDTMESLLNKSKIELFSFSRPLLCQPDLPNLMRNGTVSESKCISCNRCYSSKSHRCIFREGKNI